MRGEILISTEDTVSGVFFTDNDDITDKFANALFIMCDLDRDKFFETVSKFCPLDKMKEKDDGLSKDFLTKYHSTS